MLDELHCGITKMKVLARGYCAWKNIDQDIENKVRSCKSCCDTRDNPPCTVLHPWERPRGLWERIHVDFADPFLGKHFLIVVDAYTKWLEIVVLNSAPISKMKITALEELFSCFGLCQLMVSDNGSQFRSGEFREW